MSQIYVVTLIRKAGPVTGKCETPSHGRRKATHTVPAWRINGEFKVKRVCKACAAQARVFPAYGFDVEVKHIYTTSGAAGNAMEYATVCSQQADSNLYGWHPIDARVAQDAEYSATLEVSK
jgi:hypothetical protein